MSKGNSKPESAYTWVASLVIKAQSLRIVAQHAERIKSCITPGIARDSRRSDAALTEQDLYL